MIMSSKLRAHDDQCTHQQKTQKVNEDQTHNDHDCDQHTYRQYDDEKKGLYHLNHDDCDDHDDD